MISRRAALHGLAVAASAATWPRLSHATEAGKRLSVGISLSLTGADAASGKRVLSGALLAIKQANDAGGVAGYTIRPLILDDASSTAGQYDPMQAATNARKLVNDPAVVIAIGPMMSGSGKAMAPILNRAGLATITPSSTDPSISSPRFQQQFWPTAKPTYFRTVTTDAYQGPEMANFYAEVLRVPNVYVLDDSGAAGIGKADSFQERATAKGMQVLGRDRLDPLAADYTVVLTKIESKNATSIFFGGNMQAGVKLVKQSYDIVPGIVKGGSDGIHGVEMLTGAGFPAANGWYCSSASPHLLDDPKLANWVSLYQKTFGFGPEDYAVTCYDAALVALNAIARVAETGRPVTRNAVRDAVATTRLATLQGEVSFASNGDLATHTVSILQVTENAAYPPSDMTHQFRFVQLAPES